jgi:signal transduction histidine kinase
MQLSTQQYLITAASLLIVGVLGAMLLDTLRETRLEVERNQFASNIVSQGTSGLRVVTLEYLLRREERARKQWQSRHESIGRLLASELFENTPGQPLMRLLRQQHQELLYAFQELLTVESTGEVPLPVGEEFDGQVHFATRILLLTDEMVADTRRLLRASQDRLMSAQDRVFMLSAALVVLMLLILATNLLLIFRSVLRPVAQLNHGATELGRGNFSYRTSTGLNNEIGKLSQAFNAMAARLEQTIATLEGTQAELRVANKELESFSYSVSHDLRAPLRGIDGWSLALAEDYAAQLDGTALRYLDRVRSETQRMGRLIDDLLKLSRVTRSEIHVESVDLSGMVEELAARLRQLHAGRTIEFIIQPGLCAPGDGRLLEVALGNLLDNACKFTGPVPAAQVEFGELEASRSGNGPTGRTFYVRDNGVGFDMAHAQQLFGAFQRMHKLSEFPGTGIGLATVERVIRRHGGTIWAEASPGNGACFRFTLPASHAPALEQASPGNPLQRSG